MKRVITIVLSAACLVPVGPASTEDDAAPGVADSPESIRPLLIGSQAPSGLAPLTAEGTAYDLETALVEGPTVLIIYRGGW